MTSKNLTAVILAAGKGTRMKSSKPKVLHKILGKSIIVRVIDTIQKLNVTKCFVIVGHGHTLVEEEIQRLNYTNVRTVLQKEQLGTGHALYQLYEKLYNFDGNILVTCGDTPLLSHETLQTFIHKHNTESSDLTLLTANVETPYGLGRILRHQDQSFCKIIEEKDATSEEKKIKEINAGVYCYNWQKIFEGLTHLSTDNQQHEYYLTDLATWALDKNLKVSTVTTNHNNEILGINSQQELSQAVSILKDQSINHLMTQGVSIISPETTWISPETIIGNDTIIYPNTFIEGTNIIGEKCTLGPNTFIQGDVYIGNNTSVMMSTLFNTSIGNNCSIGPFANIPLNAQIKDNVRIGNYVEVKNSVISSNTNVAHLSYIGNAHLGHGVNIGAGTITANYNPMTNIKSTTIIGDKCKIGSNTVLVAPVAIGNCANVAAGSVITRNVPPGSLAIARERQKILEGWVERYNEKVHL